MERKNKMQSGYSAERETDVNWMWGRKIWSRCHLNLHSTSARLLLSWPSRWRNCNSANRVRGRSDPRSGCSSFIHSLIQETFNEGLRTQHEREKGPANL